MRLLRGALAIARRPDMLRSLGSPVNFAGGREPPVWIGIPPPVGIREGKRE